MVCNSLYKNKGKNKLKIKINLKNEISSNLANEKTLKKVAKQVLNIFGQKKAKITVTVFYVDEKRIRQINKEYRQTDKPTDVISFRLLENLENKSLTQKNFPFDFDPASKTIYFGEIFICESIAKSQAKEFKNSTYREGVELFVHGLLHLLGCDHHKKEETEIMKNYELQMIEILNKMKIY